MAVVAVLTLAAMVPTVLWVPVETVDRRLRTSDPGGEGERFGESDATAADRTDVARGSALEARATPANHAARLLRADGIHFKRIWRTGSRWDRDYRVLWSLVAIEAGAILFLGGGVMTWLVRRERRRRVAAGA